MACLCSFLLCLVYPVANAVKKNTQIYYEIYSALCVLAAVLMKVQVFLYVTPCGLATGNISQRCTNLGRQVAIASDFFYGSA